MSASDMNLPQTVLVTGAAGKLGQAVGRHLSAALANGKIKRLRLVDVAPIAVPSDLANIECLQLSLSTPEGAQQAVEGMLAVIHLAGVSTESNWDELIPANLAGPAYLWDACVAQGVDRVLFASSNHAVGLYDVDTTIDHTAPPCADSRYGVTKAFGEQLAALYSAKTPVRGFCMRIGSCFEHATARRHLKTFQSLSDFMRLIDVGLTADYRFEIVYGLSDIKDGFWNNSNAFRLGYTPQDHPSNMMREPLDLTDYAYQGGEFVNLPLEP